MNAPTIAAALAKPSLQLLEISALVPSKTHVQELRRARFNQAALQELARNVATAGVLQPPLARPLGAGKFEIVAGERRWLAAKIAGLKEIHVNVRELSDERALEAQLSENLQREDLHELEEAEGYEELMKLKKIDAEAVADMVGKSRSYVYARKKLLALCPEARKAFYAGELDSSRALLVARIGHHDTQRQALKDLAGDRYDGPMSYRDAHKHIVERYMLKLSGAPFDIKDAGLLPKAGDCIKCPKRTGNQAELFGDVKNADVCTDPKCFDEKRQAHFSAARRKLEVAGRKVIHGAAAKQLLPHWDSPHGNDHIRGEYVRLDQNEYLGGRYQPVANVLGEDYVPTLLEHPKTGRMIEVAPRSTVAGKAAARQKERSKGSDSNARGKAAVARPDAADKAREIEQKIDDETRQLVFAELAKKAIPGTTELRELASWLCHSEADVEVIARALGGQKGSSESYIEKLAGPRLLKAIYLLKLSDENNYSSYGDDQFKGIAKQLARLKVDPKKIEQEVRARLTPKPVDKVNAEIDKRAANAKGKKK